MLQGGSRVGAHLQSDVRRETSEGFSAQELFISAYLRAIVFPQCETCVCARLDGGLGNAHFCRNQVMFMKRCHLWQISLSAL